jgi:hypothetical protein
MSHTQNFYPDATSVSIGGASCTGVEVMDTDSLGTLRCVAPMGPGIGDVHLRVSVAGAGNASVPFLYTAPLVTGVTVDGASVAVCAADANVVIQVTGTNLGLRNSATSPDPVVYIGDSLCVEPVLLPVTPTHLHTVQCKALASAVGAYPVSGTSIVASHAGCSSLNPWPGLMF